MNYRSLNSYNQKYKHPNTTTCYTTCNTNPPPSAGSQTSGNCTKTNGVWLHNDGSPLSQCICNGYGVCNQGTNICSCNDDHIGTTCGQCAHGFVGNGETPPKCIPVGNPCKNGGTSSGGSCHCLPGFTGSNCQTAIPAYLMTENRYAYNNQCNQTDICGNNGVTLSDITCTSNDIDGNPLSAPVSPSPYCPGYTTMVDSDNYDTVCNLTATYSNGEVERIKVNQQGECSNTAGAKLLVSGGSNVDISQSSYCFLCHDHQGRVGIGPKSNPN